jgi:hypothetical protein
LQGEIESLKAELAYQKKMKAVPPCEPLEMLQPREDVLEDDQLFRQLKQQINE